MILVLLGLVLLRFVVWEGIGYTPTSMVSFLSSSLSVSLGFRFFALITRRRASERVFFFILSFP